MMASMGNPMERGQLDELLDRPWVLHYFGPETFNSLVVCPVCGACVKSQLGDPYVEQHKAWHRREC